MSKVESKALVELDAQVKVLIPKLIRNNFDVNSIAEPISDFLEIADFETYQPVIQATVEQRFKTIDESVNQKWKAMEAEKTNSAIPSRLQTELHTLTGDLRKRKSMADSSESPSTSQDYEVSGGLHKRKSMANSSESPSTLQDYEVSVQQMNENIAYLKAKIEVIEFEKIRRENYAPLLVYKAFKSKLEEVASAKKPRFCFASQEINW